jgi:hypothetical protein
MIDLAKKSVYILYKEGVYTSSTKKEFLHPLQGRSFYILYKEGACQPMLMLRMSI